MRRSMIGRVDCQPSPTLAVGWTLRAGSVGTVTLPATLLADPPQRHYHRTLRVALTGVLLAWLRLATPSAGFYSPSRFYPHYSAFSRRLRRPACGCRRRRAVPGEKKSPWPTLTVYAPSGVVCAHGRCTLFRCGAPQYGRTSAPGAVSTPRRNRPTLILDAISRGSLVANFQTMETPGAVHRINRAGCKWGGTGCGGTAG